MICVYQELTPEPWRLCRCGGKKAKCTAPERQHPNTPPFDPAGFHSERVPGADGNPRSDFFLVNSLYCTRQHCRNFTPGENRESERHEDSSLRNRER